MTFEQPKKTRPFPAFADVVIIFLALAYAMSIPLALKSGPLIDFPTYYFCSLAQEKGVDIYDQQAVARLASSTGYEGYIANYGYPPTLLVLIHPLTSFDVTTAYKLWVLFNQIILLLTIALYYLSSGKKGFIEFRPNLLISSLFIIYLYVSSSSGQVVMLMLLLMTLTYFLMKQKRSALAGVSLGFSSMVKPLTLVFLPYLLFKGELRTLSTALATMAAISILLSVYAGWDVLSYPLNVAAKRFESTTSFETHLVKADPELFGLYKAGVILLFLAVLYLSCRGVSGRYQKARFDMEYAFLLVSVLILTPEAAYYNYIYLLPVCWILYDRRADLLSVPWTRYSMTLLFLLVLTPLVYVTILSTVALWLLLLYLMFKLR